MTPAWPAPWALAPSWPQRSIALQQWRDSGKLDWKRIAKVSALSGANAALGYYAGVQIHVRLVTTEIGARLMSSLPLRASNGSIVAAYGSLGGAAATSLFLRAGRVLARSGRCA